MMDPGADEIVPGSDCDTPLNLVNATFDWFSTHLRDEIDFVVWTGDNARHDIDSGLPRSLPEIFESNRHIATRMREVFGDIPVVASIGNNGELTAGGMERAEDKTGS